MKVNTPGKAFALLAGLLLGVAALDALGIVAQPLFDLFMWMSP